MKRPWAFLTALLRKVNYPSLRAATGRVRRLLIPGEKSGKAINLKRRAFLGAVVAAVAVAGAYYYYQNTIVFRQTGTGPRIEAADVETPSPAEEYEPDVEGSSTAPQVEEKDKEGPAGREGEDIAAAPVDFTSFVTPVAGGVLVPYGFAYSPTYEDYRLNGGWDLKAEAGEEVAAALPGKVREVESDPYHGYRVVIDHGNEWETVYSQMGSVKVKEGDRVEAGQPLGEVGEPGIAGTGLGPHLHFELRHRGKAVDPETMLNGE